MPKKRFGQHFLSDPSILESIVDFSGVGKLDTVVEVGSGRGTLTRTIASRVHKVIAIEIDGDLISQLRKSIPSNVELIKGDALETNLESLSAEPYHLLGNLPYNIATPLLDRFVRARLHICSVTVLLQSEVADRILAKPGTRSYGALSVGIQYYADVALGFRIPPTAFEPQPQVDSTLIRLMWKDNVPDATDLIVFVRKAFGSRRKKLINNLGPIVDNKNRSELLEIFQKVNIRSDARPGDLSVDEYVELFKAL